jgi:hypothetical protein
MVIPKFNYRYVSDGSLTRLAVSADRRGKAPHEFIFSAAACGLR